MHVIALVTQKGGCGKSTLALSLAVAARSVNRRTLILDTDPQRTVSTWWQDREQDTPDCVEVFESTALPKALDLAKQKRFDLVFIDTPGRDDPINARVIGLADFCLIPCRPAMADMRAQNATVGVVKRLVLQLYFWTCSPFVVPVLGDTLMPAAPRRPGQNPFHFLLRGQH